MIFVVGKPDQPEGGQPGAPAASAPPASPFPPQIRLALVMLFHHDSFTRLVPVQDEDDNDVAQRRMLPSQELAINLAYDCIADFLTKGKP